MKNKHIILLLVIFTIVLSSCKKKVLFIHPVFEIERNMSIPNGGEIKHFSFPTPEIGFAASDTDFIYKTIDGGLNWDKKIINTSSGYCNGVEFVTDKIGICLMGNKVYSTDDGGLTWTYRTEADFIDKTEGGTFVLTKRRSVYPATIYNDIKISTDSAQSFQLIASVIVGYKTKALRVTDSKAIVIGDDYVKCVDLETHNNFSLDYDYYHDGIPDDVYLYNDLEIVIANANLYVNGYEKLEDVWFRSVDGYGDLVICAGYYGVKTNMDIGSEYEWNEVLRTNGDGFSQEFNKIRFINENTCYLCGNNGVFYKVRI
jgi:photosystem II stability/assembly factor-like uncharacterized protein